MAQYFIAVGHCSEMRRKFKMQKWPPLNEGISQCQIIGPIIAAVLIGTDVLDGETIDRSELLRQQAVFATVIRPLPNQLA